MTIGAREFCNERTLNDHLEDGFFSPEGGRGVAHGASRGIRRDSLR